MKKRILFLIVITACLLTVIGLGEASYEEENENRISFFPNSLKAIEKEAFSGTSLTSVKLPAGITKIEDSAFKNNRRLKAINIPDDIAVIDGNPFPGNNDLVLFVSSQSYGREWAEEKSIRHYIEIRLATIKEYGNKHTGAITNTQHIFITQANERIQPVEKEKERTGRQYYELKAKLYGGHSSIYVQSRYFP